MAVTGDFFTLDGVSEIAEEGRKSFNLLLGMQELDLDNLVQSTIDHLQQKIDEMEGLEEDFKKSFNCGSLEEFAQRVEAYYHKDNNLSVFTGGRLKQIVNDFKTQLDEQSAELQQHVIDLFKAFLTQYVQTNFANDILNGKELSEAMITPILEEFIKMLSNVHIGSGQLRLDVQKARFISSPKKGKASLQMIANRGTDAFKVYVEEAYKQATSQSGITYNGQKIQINSKTKVSTDEVNMSFGINFANIIRSSGVKMLTKTEIEKRLKEGTLTEEQIDIKNAQIIQLICNELGVEGFYKEYVIKRLEYMLSTNGGRYMFFVGNSFTNLEGILGEINAVVAITHLLGSKYTEAALKWIGSQTNQAGKQPSIDVVVDNLVGGVEKAKFGFQIKNTMDELLPDITHYINFANKDLSTILEHAGISSDAIENVYFSDTFNVPYKREGKWYEEVGYNTPFSHNDPITKALFDEYVRIDMLIDSIVDDINTYLARFAADFIYMQQDTDFKHVLATLDTTLTGTKTTGNFCYIVGSQTFFANRMLQGLQKQLEALQSLKAQSQKADLQFQTYFYNNTSEKSTKLNIVTAMNKGAHLSDYTLKMRSSWGFHK